MNSGKCIPSMLLNHLFTPWHQDQKLQMGVAPTPLQFLHRRFDQPPLSSQKSQKRSQKCCDFFQLLFFTSVWQWATVRVKKLFWHGCSLVFIVHPLEIFGPKRLNFYLRIRVALDMGLAWFRNCKFKPYPQPHQPTNVDFSTSWCQFNELGLESLVIERFIAITEHQWHEHFFLVHWTMIEPINNHQQPKILSKHQCNWRNIWNKIIFLLNHSPRSDPRLTHNFHWYFQCSSASQNSTEIRLNIFTSPFL